MKRGLRAARRWCPALLVAIALGGCTDGDTRDSATAVGDIGDSATAVGDIAADVGTRYEFELVSPGDAERRRLVTVAPVGRQIALTVRLSSQGDAIDVGLMATVLRADADGRSEDVELRIVSVDADDRATVDGLAPILDASSVVRRDSRRAVVEQVIDLPDGLGFRGDAVARQALRAPFALVGPLPVQPVGTGAEWTVTTIVDGNEDTSREVTVVAMGAESYVLRSALGDGSIEITGRLGTLLPDEQIIDLVDAELRIIAEAS